MFETIVSIIVGIFVFAFNGLIFSSSSAKSAACPVCSTTAKPCALSAARKCGATSGITLAATRFFTTTAMR